MKQETKIALFGGSFDPIHLGHIKLLEAVLETFALDQIHLIPCKQSPHKKNAPIATDQERLEMCRLATAHLKNVTVSDIEITRDSPSYTWMTVEHFLDIYPDAQLYWIMGTDQWRMLEHWSRFEFLRDNLNFIVVERQSAVLPKDNIQYETLRFNQDVSSTQIRKSLLAGMPYDLLSTEVSNYISAKKLYQSDS